MKVFCADFRCKYNNNKDRCTAQEVRLAFGSYLTVNEGRKEVLMCRTYEESEENKRLTKMVEDMFRE